MPFDSAHTPKLRSVRLARRTTLVLDDAHTGVISVDYGCVWITLQNDSRDIVLMPGMRFEIDREGRTLVTAEEDSRLRISLPAPWRDRIFAALANLLARFRQRAPGGAAAQKSPFAASFASTSGGSRRPVPYY